MIDIGIVIVYVITLVAIGLKGGKQVKSAADFTAADKQYGTFVIFATLSASFIGGGYSSGNAAAAFENGIGTSLCLFGFGFGMILIGKYVAAGVGRFPSANTVGGVITASYGESAGLLTGLFSFVCCAGIVGAQMETIGLIFHALLGVSPTLGTLLGCGIVLIYTTFGGLGSVIFADIVQFLLLAIGMPLLLLSVIIKAGGVHSLLADLPPSLLSPLNNTTLPAFLSLFFSLMCGEALAPPYMQRLLIGKSATAVAKGTTLSGWFSFPFFLITGGIGLAARAMHVTDNPALAMPALILQTLPMGLRGILMAAMVSIVLSAADSFLNGATISLVCDTILPCIPKLSDRSSLRLLRLVNLFTGIFAAVISFCVPDVFSILLLAYSFWSPVILVPLVAALLGVRADKYTFFISALSGFFACLIWKVVLHQPFGIDGCLVGIPANLVAFMLCRWIRASSMNGQIQKKEPAVKT